MKNTQKFVNAMKERFEGYFLACGIKKVGNRTLFSVIIEDRDVRRMEKKDLIRKVEEITHSLLSNSIGKGHGGKKPEAKVYLLSDLNQNSVWAALGDSATVMDTKAISSFVRLNLPERFFDAYDLLPPNFKLEDIRREFEKISERKYHRNTYQIWLKGLQKAGIVKLVGKRYDKILRARK